MQDAGGVGTSVAGRNVWQHSNYVIVANSRDHESIATSDQHKDDHNIIITWPSTFFLEMGMMVF